jgi:hypothetical protein
MSSVPVCPLLSIRNESYNELCLTDQCALYLPAAKKCSLVFIGYQAFLEAQKIQQQQQQQQPPQG